MTKTLPTREANISREINLTGPEREKLTGLDLVTYCLETYTDQQYDPAMPLQWIYPWDKNPRKVFDDGGLRELADSIEADGVQQPIVVHRNEEARPHDDRFQIIMGERRYRASRMAGKTTIPVIVRVGLDELTRLRLAVLENCQRLDLNPIEEARSFAALEEAGERQVDIAALIKRSQAYIANRKRLLQLPEDVQQRILSGELSPSHGTALVRWAAHPAVCSQMAVSVVTHKIASHWLEGDTLPNQLLHDLKENNVLVRLSYNTPFDWESKKAPCQQCPFGALVKFGDYYSYCANPTHYQELAEAAEAEKQAARQKAQEEIEKKQAAAREALAQKTAPTASTSPAATTPETPAVDLPPVAKPEIPTMASLGYGNYVTIPEKNCAPGCSADCSCRGMAIDYKGDAVPICTDKPRYDKLAKAEETARRKALKDGFTARQKAQLDIIQVTTKRLTDAEGKARMVAHRRAMAIIISSAIQNVPQGSVASALKASGLNLTVEQIRSLASPYTDPRVVWEYMTGQKPEALLTFALDCLLSQEVKEKLEYDGRKTYKIEFMEEGKAPAPDAAQTEPEPVASAEAESEDDPEDAETCLRCGQAIADDLLGAPIVRSHNADREDVEEVTAVLDWLESGVLVANQCEYYCPACVEAGVEFCRVCGCTQEIGCAEGCGWAETDGEPICTLCAEKQAEPANDAGPGTIALAGSTSATPAAAENSEADWEMRKCASCGVLEATNGLYCAKCDPSNGIASDLERTREEVALL